LEIAVTTGLLRKGTSGEKKDQISTTSKLWKRGGKVVAHTNRRSFDRVKLSLKRRVKSTASFHPTQEEMKIRPRKQQGKSRY